MALYQCHKMQVQRHRKYSDSHLLCVRYELTTRRYETPKLYASNQGEDDHAPSSSRGANSFLHFCENGALGKRLEELFEALRDPERQRSLRDKLDKLEDEGCWQSLNSAVGILKEMVQSAPTVLPLALFNSRLYLDISNEKN